MECFYRELGTSRQAISQMKKREDVSMIKDKSILKIVEEWRQKHPKMGSRSLFYTIQNIGGVELGIGVNKFEQLLKREGLTMEKPVKKWIKTSDGLGKESYKNLINGLELNNINQLIVGDITYYPLESQMSYIFTLKDIYSQRILSLIPTLKMEASYGIQCLEEAILQRKGHQLKGCIHHSDNGSQYNAILYKKCLANVGMIISRAKNCLENGSAENLNDLVKNRYLIPWNVNSFNDLKEACKEVKTLSNEKRAVKELGNLSPEQFEQLIKTIPKHDKPIKKLYDFDSK
jgi:putative transposase